MATEVIGSLAIPRLKERYRNEIAPALKDEFSYANVMQIPGLSKIVVNMGVGEAARDAKLIDGIPNGVAALTAGGSSRVVRVQTGSIAAYAFAMLIGLVFLVSVFLLFLR